MVAPTHTDSKVFTPLKIGNGKIELKNRVILAPMTRNRCLPLIQSKDEIVRAWFPDELVAEYYAQRTTKGGLLITEGIWPSVQGGGTPGTAGLVFPEQIAGWKKVVEAVHAKGGFIYAQLWHQGHTTLTPLTGLPPVSPSGLSWEDPEEYHSHAPLASDGSTGEKMKYADYPPVAMTVSMIKDTIQEYCDAARRAVEECGFDGIEVHGANGYLPEQFLSSNINIRTDEYGGSSEKRTTFVVELMERLASTVGEENVAIRLSPFGLFNWTRGTKRIEAWSHLCRQLKSRLPNMSYASFIELRYEQIVSLEEKESFLSSSGLIDVDLSVFRNILGEIPFFSGGGWNDKNCWEVVESGACDACVIGRYFTSNPDLPQRLKEGKALRPYERSRFYGPFPDRERGFTDYEPLEEGESGIERG